MNLSKATSNIRLPNDVMTEKHSRIRISCPLVTQTQLDLALVGRKMVPLYTIKTAITMKETEGTLVNRVDMLNVPLDYKQGDQ